ncbi:MAG TPA: outer membrane protein assembly factor BamD [Halothiobacillus sp.]|nr:outer membrane protein assembly factor BamD [Halothiobacillus sp.]
MSLTHRLTLVTALIVSLGALNSCSWFSKSKEDPLVEPMVSAAQLYNEASSALRRRDYATAIAKYETLEGRYPFGAYTEQAQLEVAYAYYKYEEPDLAIAAADRYMRLHPRGEHVDYALYLKGLANMDRGQTLITRFFKPDLAKRDQRVLEEAYRAFAELVERFPESRYVDDSSRRLIELRNMLAERELYVADYYMRRGAWLAAANRAQTVIERYDGSSAIPDALVMLIRAYDKLGLDDLSSDTRQILEINFPDRAAQLK